DARAWPSSFVPPRVREWRRRAHVGPAALRTLLVPSRADGGTRVKLLAVGRAAATPEIGFARCTQAGKQVGERSSWSLGGFRARSTRTPTLLDIPREQD